jgi:hypothetical protein
MGKRTPPSNRLLIPDDKNALITAMLTKNQIKKTNPEFIVGKSTVKVNKL